MRRALIPHPATPGTALSALEAEIDRGPDGRLALRYRAAGDPAAVRLAPAAPPERRDELWKQTCFEAFIRAGAGSGYLELNFAPSGDWAAYRFDGYRAGMRPALDVGAPAITLAQTEAGFEVAVAVDLSATEDLAGDTPWAVGLSAVIEAADGRMSYWALAHPPKRPDFHHADCFALELPATERP